MFIEYESIVVKSRILLAIYMGVVAIAVVIKHLISSINENDDDRFYEYGFRECPLYVTKLHY